MKIRWPRGRYNGRRIAGFKVSLGVDLLWWNWRPRASRNFGMPYLLWLCFAFRCETVYHVHD